MSRKDKKQAKAAADGAPKKSRRKGCLIAVLVVLVIGVIGAIAGGGSNNGKSTTSDSTSQEVTTSSDNSSSDQGDSSADTQESTPTSRITRNTTDVEASVVSVDETGVTLTLTSDEHDNTLVVPNYYKIGDDKYNILGSDDELNPQVHFSQNGEDISTATLDIKAGTSQDVHMSVDGVTDYSHFEVNLDDVLYEDGGQSWHMKDLVIEVTTE